MKISLALVFILRKKKLKDYLESLGKIRLNILVSGGFAPPPRLPNETENPVYFLFLRKVPKTFHLIAENFLNIAILQLRF